MQSLQFILNTSWIKCVLLILELSPLVFAHDTVDDYLNKCLDGHNHKYKPSKESSLFSQCSPWKERSCCTEDIAKNLHIKDKWYNFDWNHCEQQLSPACRGHFIQDLCFYECSPNTGPWLIPVKMKIRNEKFVDVPLCQRECSLWWNDCKEDFTCLQNWGRGFNWTTGTNTCPLNKPCKKFKDIYSGATEFCESVWDHSWKVVPDKEPCMLLWFHNDRENPNDIVARQKAEQLVGGATVLVSNIFTSALILIFCEMYKRIVF